MILAMSFGLWFSSCFSSNDPNVLSSFFTALDEVISLRNKHLIKGKLPLRVNIKLLN